MLCSSAAASCRPVTHVHASAVQHEGSDQGPLARQRSRVTLGGVMTQVQPTGRVAAHGASRLRGVMLVRSQTYEITFTGQAGPTLRAEFDDCEVTIGPGTTTLRAELPDPAALAGLVQRITGLRLEVTYLRLVAPPR
jgi:hypothetical protein